MAIQLIADETNNSITAKVFTNKALKVSSGYSYVFIGSGTATGVIAASSGILHSVVFCDSATATTFLQLTDSATIANAIGDVSANAVALFGTITKNNFIFDAVFNSGLCYRLSGTAGAPTIITYAVAG